MLVASCLAALNTAKTIKISTVVTFRFDQWCFGMVHRLHLLTPLAGACQSLRAQTMHGLTIKALLAKIDIYVHLPISVFAAVISAHCDLSNLSQRRKFIVKVVHIPHFVMMAFINCDLFTTFAILICQCYVYL